ncbi:MAG: acyltransferase domain-containing protein, partial [Anaerolineales bacterium]|nr:acyltransferase domain-containing protein [Anaerolineales bacterium]
TYSQPALFAIEYALSVLWQSWGISPTIVTGHSVGEYAAACAADVFSLEEGVKLVAARGRLMDALPLKGLMVAVFANEEQVREAIKPYAERVSIAVINGPKNVVISGECNAVEETLAHLQKQRIRARRLAVAQASHSPLVDPMLDDLEAVAAAMALSAPQTTYVSGMTGTAVNGTHLTQPTYWREHQRLAVRFSDAMQTLFAAGFRHFLEIGPDNTLLSMARRLPLPEEELAWLPSLSANTAWETLLTSLGTLYVQGAGVNWNKVSG